MAPSGILREAEGSMANGNIWLMVSITHTVQFKIFELYVFCVCVCLAYMLLIKV